LSRPSIGISSVLWFLSALLIAPAMADEMSTGVSPIVQFTVAGNNSKSAIRGADVTAAEFYHVEDAMEFASQLDTVDAVSVIAPDEGRAPAGNSSLGEVAQKIKAKSRQVVRAPAQLLPEWFQKNQRRITIILIEMTLVTGVKYSELMISGAPISHAAALATGLVNGAIVDVVEWNIIRIMNFVAIQGTPVKSFFNRVSSVAKNPAIRKKIEATLTTAWQLAKNTAVNFSLFEILKFSIYATVQADGSFDHRILQAFEEMMSSGVFKTAGLAGIATVISFPTTKVILALRDRAVKAAGTDALKLLRARDLTMALASAAMTARAILFSSLFVAEKIESPALAATAIGGLTVMFTGSIWKLVRDKRAALVHHEKCEGLLETAAESSRP